MFKKLITFLTLFAAVASLSACNVNYVNPSEQTTAEPITEEKFEFDWAQSVAPVPDIKNKQPDTTGMFGSQVNYEDELCCITYANFIGCKSADFDKYISDLVILGFEDQKIDKKYPYDYSSSLNSSEIVFGDETTEEEISADVSEESEETSDKSESESKENEDGKEADTSDKNEESTSSADENKILIKYMKNKKGISIIVNYDQGVLSVAVTKPLK